MTNLKLEKAAETQIERLTHHQSSQTDTETDSRASSSPSTVNSDGEIYEAESVKLLNALGIPENLHFTSVLVTSFRGFFSFSLHPLGSDSS